MWRLPGYGDHLAERDPGIRERQGDGGRAGRVRRRHRLDQPDRRGEPARWGVTFAVGDTDAAVARAVELGATVVVDPFDAPAVRIAVLADPQGAVFTVSHFDPTTL